jgi:hypothetical protein
MGSASKRLVFFCIFCRSRRFYVLPSKRQVGEQRAKGLRVDISIRATEDDEFCLCPSNSHGEHEEAVVLAIVKRIDMPTGRQPLQCITFKSPFHEYEKLKSVTQRWKLQYTVVLRIFMRIAISVLESPTGELREQLERHRESEIEKARLREEARSKRLSQYAT